MELTSEQVAACCDLVSQVAQFTGRVTVKLTGTSMLPAIWPGDVLTFERCQASELRAGEIVLCHSGGRLTAHRLVSFRKDNLILRGDCRMGCDPPVPSNQLVGRLKAINRDGLPVPIELSSRHRLISPLLRRSRLCIRLFLRFQAS